MAKRKILKNGEQSVAFVLRGKAYRPEWFRLGKRPMLRFKDHEFLNIGGVRVVAGQLWDDTGDSLLFGGEELFAGVRVGWSVLVSVPADGGPGFTVATRLVPLDEPVELLEALTTFELPYEYDGHEQQMTVMCQQPVYRFEGNKELSGAGFMHPNWYYGRVGRAHLTYPSSSPLMINRTRGVDGGNERCTMLIGNWNVCSVRDMFAQPTRNLGDAERKAVFPDANLKVAPGRRGMKFLIGTLNWNTSLHKDPNVIVDVNKGLQQEVTVDFAGTLPGKGWDMWLAQGWERMARIHFPKDGHVPAWEIAKSRGASWVESAEWLTAQFEKPEGCPGFFSPDRGTCVYAPHTRPKWDSGVEAFCGQWTGPVSYLGHVWNDGGMATASQRLERIFNKDTAHPPDQIWTIGPTPLYTAVMRKALLAGVQRDTLRKVAHWVRRRTEVVLNPPEGGRRGDGGILAWDAFANLLAADLFDRAGREACAKELLKRVNQRLDGAFWAFNCAAEGDLVGAGQARPFGHAIAMTANVMAYRRFGNRRYLDAAERFGNLLLGMHYITYNESPSPDLDTRGWCLGSTGGRDQTAQLPPWETAHALQQFAYLIDAGRGRDGFFDAMWLFAHTGLAMFSKARTMKRLYTPQMGITYRQIDEVASEREFYLKLPYLAYENPWDQTMLAGYQGVEPIILNLLLGGGLVRAEDDRVLALVPRAAMYDAGVARRFELLLWNPLQESVTTTLRATVAEKRREAWAYRGPASGRVTAANSCTAPIEVPPRQVTRVIFQRA